MTDFVVVGDVAYLPAEWERLERRRAQQREYRKRPEIRERQRLYMREWRRRNRERHNEYRREWMRRYRAQQREQAA